MKLGIVLLACLALAAASSIKTKKDVKYFDTGMLEKQKFFLEVVFKYWDKFESPKYDTIGNSLITDKTLYVKYDEDMEYFRDMWKTGHLTPKEMNYNFYSKTYTKELLGLFKMFYYAKDYATLQQNIIWARKYLHSHTFIYVLHVFVAHHPDYKFVVLPSLYEMYPYGFFNGKFIYTAKNFDYDYFKYEQEYEKKWVAHYKTLDVYQQQHIRKFNWYNKKFYYVKDFTLYKDEPEMMEEAKYKTLFEGTKMFWMKADYSDTYGPMNEDAKLTYFTEDFDLGNWLWWFQIYYPSWMVGKEFGLEAERRGELFYSMLYHLRAHYYLERLSHKMEPVEEFSWYAPIKSGYNPHLTSYGIPYSYRHNYWEMKDSEEFYSMNAAMLFEERAKNVIGKGYYVFADGTKFFFNKPEAIEQLGLLLGGSVDSIDRQFFRSFFEMYNTILAGGEYYELMGESKYFDNRMPNVLQFWCKMIRDPLFYQYLERIVYIFDEFKTSLGHYKQTELLFPGVKILDVKPEKFVTFYDWIDYDVSSLLDRDYFFKDGVFKWDWALFGRRLRLNNKPFTISYDFESNKVQKMVFRTFLGPKFDSYGKLMTLDMVRDYYLELDTFVVDAVEGKNTYVRSSIDFFWTLKDHTTYFELYKYVFTALEGKFQFPVDYEMNKFCGFPKNLIFPRGWTEGMPMKLYVIATPYDSSVKRYTAEEHQMDCGYDYDLRSYRFPLDRPIKENYFWTENMFFKDVYIYHLNDLHIPKEYHNYYTKFQYTY